MFKRCFLIDRKLWFKRAFWYLFQYLNGFNPIQECHKNRNWLITIRNITGNYLHDTIVNTLTKNALYNKKQKKKLKFFWLIEETHFADLVVSNPEG